MRAVLFFSMLIVTLLAARENPFQPMTEGTDIGGKAAAQTEGVTTPDIRNGAEVLNFEHIRFVLKGNGIRIETEDELLKHYAIRKPTRFILDFKSDADFPTRKRALATVPFKEIRIGVHKGFYRVVVELENDRNFTVEKIRYGYQLILK